MSARLATRAEWHRLRKDTSAGVEPNETDVIVFVDDVDHSEAPTVEERVVARASHESIHLTLNRLWKEMAAVHGVTLGRRETFVALRAAHAVFDRVTERAREFDNGSLAADGISSRLPFVCVPLVGLAQ